MRTEDQHKILLVEDDLDIAEEIAEILQALGYQCTHVETRDAAESAVQEEEFCLVLMDLRIRANGQTLAPRIEAGRTMLERLRRKLTERLPSGQHRTPLIVLSAHTQAREEAVRLMQLGATDVLEKPLSNNSPGLDVRIATALACSQRSNHNECGVLARRAPAEAGPLQIDVARREVHYRGVRIPTSPQTCKREDQHHLQEQPFAVLVALASRPGERISEEELNQFLFLNNLLGDNVGSDLSAIRARIVRAIRDATPKAVWTCPRNLDSWFPDCQAA